MISSPAPAVKPTITVCEMKFDQRAEPRESHRKLHARRPASASVSTSVDVRAGCRHGERRHRREHDQRQRVGRPGDLVPRRAPQRGDDRRHDRAVEAVLRREAGERRVGDTLRKDDQRADEPGDRILAQRPRR